VPKFILIVILTSLLAFAGCNATSPVSADRMTSETMASLIQKFDKDAKVNANSVEFKLNEHDLILVYDKKADRMRIIAPIAQSGIASEEVLVRMLQANYDAVLDTRYAMANNIIWATFIHPLSSLTQEDFLSGIAQTVTAVDTFGSTYTSGAMVFGGGDSNSLHEGLLKELEKVIEEDAKGRGI